MRLTSNSLLVLVGKKSDRKNREASVGAGLISVAETFSLSGSLSSPQQPIAITEHSTKNLELVNARKLAVRKLRKIGTFPWDSASARRRHVGTRKLRTDRSIASQTVYSKLGAQAA